MRAQFALTLVLTEHSVHSVCATQTYQQYHQANNTGDSHAQQTPKHSLSLSLFLFLRLLFIPPLIIFDAFARQPKEYTIPIRIDISERANCVPYKNWNGVFKASRE